VSGWLVIGGITLAMFVTLLIAAWIEGPTYVEAIEHDVRNEGSNQ
jgi:hypothetical protein